jgi:hypothetical protein
MFAEGSEFFPVFANAYRFCIDRMRLKLGLRFDAAEHGSKPQNR